MKYALLLLFFVFLPTTAFAEDGNSSTQVHVETNGSTSETHISVESNGVKKEIHTTTPGVIEVKIENGKETTTSTTTNTNISTQSSESSPSGTPTLKKIKKIKKLQEEKKHLIETFIERLKNIFSSLFK